MSRSRTELVQAWGGQAVSERMGCQWWWPHLAEAEGREERGRLHAQGAGVGVRQRAGRGGFSCCPVPTVTPRLVQVALGPDGSQGQETGSSRCLMSLGEGPWAGCPPEGPPYPLQPLHFDSDGCDTVRHPCALCGHTPKGRGAWVDLASVIFMGKKNPPRHTMDH